MTFANFPELGRALTQQCSRAVLPEQSFAKMQTLVLVETRTLDLLDLVVPSTNSATQPQLLFDMCLNKQQYSSRWLHFLFGYISVNRTNVQTSNYKYVNVCSH